MIGRWQGQWPGGVATSRLLGLKRRRVALKVVGGRGQSKLHVARERGTKARNYNRPPPSPQKPLCPYQARHLKISIKPWPEGVKVKCIQIVPGPQGSDHLGLRAGRKGPGRRRRKSRLAHHVCPPLPRSSKRPVDLCVNMRNLGATASFPGVINFKRQDWLRCEQRGTLPTFSENALRFQAKGVEAAPPPPQS